MQDRGIDWQGIAAKRDLEKLRAIEERDAAQRKLAWVYAAQRRWITEAMGGVLRVHDAIFDDLHHGDPDDQVGQARLQELGRVCGILFGIATLENNDPKVCEELVRPGPPVMPAGSEEPHLRRVYRAWLAEERERQQNGSGGSL